MKARCAIVASFLVSFLAQVHSAHSHDDKCDDVELRIVEDLSPPNREETLASINALRRANATSASEKYQNDRLERLMLSRLRYYNVPVDGFMLGSIAVELLRSGERIYDGPCSALEIIASSISNVTTIDIWAAEGGKLCSFHDVCLSALETDCRYTGAVRVCNVSSEYPNGFVKKTALRGVATFEFLGHVNMPDLNGRKLKFEVYGSEHKEHDHNKVYTNKVYITNKGHHLALVDPAPNAFPKTIATNTPLPPIQLVIMYKDPYDNQTLKICNETTCGNDAFANVDVTVPRKLNGVVLKAFTAKNNQLESSRVDLGGDKVHTQVITGDLSIREEAQDGRVIFTDIRLLDIYDGIQLNFTASQSIFSHSRVPLHYDDFPSSKAVFLTPPFDVIAQKAARLQIDPETDPTPGTTVDANFPFPQPIQVFICDANGNKVTSGPDSSLSIRVSAVPSACLTNSVINATKGVAFFYDSVCEGGRFQLNFSMHSLTENATFYVLSNAFDVVEEIRIGLLAPQPGVYDFYGSAFSTMVTLALEDVNDPNKFETIFPGQKGRRKLSYFVGHMPPDSETLNTAPEVAAIRSIMDLITKDRIHLLLGPTQNLDFDSMAMMPGVFNVTQIGLFPQGERFTYQQRYPFLTLFAYSFDRFGQALAHYCATHGWKRVAVIWNSKLPVPRSFRQEAANLGIEIVADEYILGVDSVPNVPNLQEINETLKNLPNYSENFRRIKEEDVDVILSFPFSQDSWHLYKQAILHEIAPYHGYQWVAAGTLAAMSFPPQDFYSCSVPEKVTCAEGFAGMVEVVQYLLRDIRQYELWAELERRVNMLDPTEYDTAIRYPRRFTFLLLGMVYDAVVLFMKAVSDLIDMNQTLSASAITNQLRSSNDRGLFPFSFENGDRAGYRGVEVNLKVFNDTQGQPDLSFEINYSFELNLTLHCSEDESKCRGLLYKYLNPSTPVASEWWAKPLIQERRMFLSNISTTDEWIFGFNSIPVTFECESGCGGGPMTSKETNFMWGPGVCDDFNKGAQRRFRLKEEFFITTSANFLQLATDFYVTLFTEDKPREWLGSQPECEGGKALLPGCQNLVAAVLPISFVNSPTDDDPLCKLQMFLPENELGFEHSPVCVYHSDLCGPILQRCGIFNTTIDQGNLDVYRQCAFDVPNFLERCQSIPYVEPTKGYIDCLGVHVTVAMCEALFFHNVNCTDHPIALEYVNGRCKAPNQCECRQDPYHPSTKGWKGDNCETPVCDALKDGCNGNGDCVNPSTCSCYPGFEPFSRDSDDGGCFVPNCNDDRIANVRAQGNSKIVMGPGGACQNDGTCKVTRLNSTFLLEFRGVNRTFDHQLTCECTPEYTGILCKDKSSGAYLSIILPTVLIAGLVIVIVVSIQYKVRRMRIQDELANTDWRIRFDDVYVQPDRRPFGWNGRRSPSGGSSVSARTLSTLRVGSVASPLPECVIYKGQTLALKRVTKNGVKLTDEVVAEIRFMRGLRHVNLVSFIGVCIEYPNVGYLMEYASKGSLRDVLDNDDIRLDWGFRYSLARDLAQGMDFLHRSDLRWHGRLTSRNCLIDSHWVLKVTDFGLHHFKQGCHSPDENVELQKLLWVAPEMLVVSEPQAIPVESLFVGIDSSKSALVSRTLYITRLPGGTKKGDVFAFGMILYELLTRQLPFFDCNMSLKQVLAHMQRDPEFRPALPPDNECPAKYVDVVELCWADCPEDRPSFPEVLTAIKREHDPGTLVDNMVAMLEKYSSDLEELVEERTKALAEEKARSETILYQMIPKKVAQQLKAGNKIAAEQFEEVTVCFCDIVGFTKIAANSTPLQVIGLLNDLYSRFDKVIDSYNVFKLGTIGDAYIVVSGLPERTGPHHAPEIANTALDLMASINGFTIKHFPDLHLQLRIGLHSGPCVAGVVGLKVPHYCVFGDTVNIASRMESTGFALRIHVSSTTTRILRRIGGYHIETRGKINLKGKGPMVTSWLLGREGFDKELPPWDKAIPEEHHDFKGIENLKVN